MVITLYPISLLIFASIFICLPLILLLWMAPWGNRRANHCLALLLVVSCVIAAAQLPMTELPPLPTSYFYIFSLQLLPGPLLFFFTLLLTHPGFSWQRQHLLHLLPAPLMALVWWLQQPLSESGLLNLPCARASGCELLYQARFLHRFSTYLSLIGYCSAALWVLRPHLSRIKQHYSEIEQVHLRWLKVLLSCYVVATLLAVGLEWHGFFHPRPQFSTGVLQGLSPLVLALTLGYFGLQQRHIQLETTAPRTYTPIVASASETEQQAQPQQQAQQRDGAGNAPGKYQTSSLTESAAAEIWEQLQQRMLRDKPHLKPGLKIADLALTLDVPVHHLSECINGFARQSFYDFINQRRVEEAARLLTDPQHRHLSVTDIGLQAGFNSNSTFFTHFKKRLQMTPKQFRQRQSEASTPPPKTI
ncbi:helix-turn-helix transcriptional regulator [Microbulbifer celer]|uniref:Helix-turn-helix transcriptional regulator n=1 Tax=Microbulbifer celer TaxID=435905 RepID=A0ABW3UDM0_9GAMM|nr:helix-turn-helix transcriptional regulator [Microbulbifer celer]UFN56017.1 helix-turn-helix domain-containing protein [Microbulbifer celer]